LGTTVFVAPAPEAEADNRIAIVIFDHPAFSGEMTSRQVAHIECAHITKLFVAVFWARQQLFHTAQRVFNVRKLLQQGEAKAKDHRRSGTRLAAGAFGSQPLNAN
jgi:hypothetical protein